MRRPVSLLLGLVLSAGFAGGAIDTPKNQPVEITSTGETGYENGLATARDNVAIHVGDTDIYADSAKYNAQTHEISVEGNVRIYRDTSLYLADHGTYNTETKEIKTDEMRTDYEPYFVAGADVTSISANGYRIENGSFTTHDSSDPSFHLRARTIRVYEKDYVVFQNVTFYIGKVPVLWWPYVYQSLNDAFSFSVSPAFLSSWGPSLLTKVTIPITDKINGDLHLDYRTRRGVAAGFDAITKYGKDDDSWAKLKTYYLQDQNPDINRTDLPRGSTSDGRYRVSVQDYTLFRDDIYGIVNATKLSDQYLMQDFYPAEFRVDPVPDNVVSIAKTNPLYTLTAIARFQANDFFETTERLPEVVLDVQRHPLFGGPIFYEGETGFANLKLKFADGAGYQDYSAVRFDTFHQFLYPNTYFGWLSIVPRVGFRETYYSRTRNISDIDYTQTNPLIPSFLLPNPTNAMPLNYAGDTWRPVVNAGAEASFKISREWEDVQSRAWGLDGLRHIVQPFTNFSWVSNPGPNPEEILQFDRYVPSTQLRTIDFPQFTTIDSIDHWTVWRLGVRNRLQTRRDDLTVSWLDLDTYVDVNFDNPYDRTPYSNLINKVRFTPLPWASVIVSAQVPAFDKGFTEINTNVVFQPMANLQITAGQRFLNSDPFFKNSSLFVVGGYCRIDDNWGFGIQEQYEATSKTLQQQRYSIYRDLTSWVASFGAVIQDNGDVKNYGVLLTFTLKAFPKIGLDFNFDPSGALP
jgi:LPS-assembly protein